MSIPSSDLESKLKQSGGARVAKRLPVHDQWVGSALGVALTPPRPSRPSSGLPKPQGASSGPKDKNEAALLFAQMKPKLAAALEQVGEKPFFYIFKTLVDEQADLKLAMSNCETQLGDADDKTATRLVNEVAFKMAATHATQLEAKTKYDLHHERDAKCGDRRVKAAKPLNPGYDWLTAAQVELQNAENDYNATHYKTDAAGHRKLVDAFLAKLVPAEAAMQKALDVAQPYDLIRPVMAKALADMNAGGAALKKAKQELKQAADLYDAGLAAADLSQAEALAATVRAKLAEITVATLGGPNASGADGRKKVMAITDEKERQAILLALSGSKEGRDKIDEMVGDLGKSVKKQPDKDFIKQALCARCGIDKLEGDLTTKALPRLYKVMKDLPASHTIDNKRLKTIERHRKSGEGASWYTDTTDTVILNMDETGNVGRVGRFRRNVEKLNKKEVKSFDTTALHEIGHAVDARFSFMTNNGKGKSYGGWNETHKVDDIADIAGSNKVLGAGKAFFDEFGTGDNKAFLKNYLKQALLGQEAVVQAAAGADPANLAKDPAIAEAVTLRDANKKGDKPVPDKTQVKLVAQAMKKTKVKEKQQRELIQKVVTKILADAKIGADKASQEFLDNCKIPDTPPKVDWAAMAKHPAVLWCQGVRLNGAHSGLWDQGKAGASSHAVGSKVYQESYTGKWVSYDVDARSHEVSNYQFRAAGEWFAEIYAAYYQKLLPPSHVDAKWFKTDVHERKK